VTIPALDDADLHAILGTALSGGGQFAELYVEQRRSRSVSVDDGRVEDLVTGLDRGGGVRVVADGRTAYAFTNLLARDALVEAAEIAAAGADHIAPEVDIRSSRKVVDLDINPELLG
jgi:TldD protein